MADDFRMALEELLRMAADTWSRPTVPPLERLAVLPTRAESVRVNVPRLRMPPPSVASNPSATVSPESATVTGAGMPKIREA